MTNGKRSPRYFSSDNLLCLLLCVVALLMIGLASFQQFIMYNPVPVWDMLQGYLGFLEKISTGNWRAWFIPHNEHRIFLQRLLFWADNYVFGGTNVFLIIANSLLIAVNVLLLSLIGLRNRRLALLLPLLVAWCYLLCQGENITWAFQGQFHQAYLFPLLGLYLLAVEGDRVTVARVVGAVLIGWLSVGTMGNGIAASPIFLLLALLLRLPLWSIALLVLGNAVQFVTLKLLHASPPAGLLQAISSDPLLFSRFIIRLLGSPFYYLLGESDRYYQPEIFGLIFLTLLTIKTVQTLAVRSDVVRAWALILFACYVIVSYAGAAVSRMGLGINTSLALHYTTPAILGWAAIALLYVDWIENQFQEPWRRTGFVVFVGVLLTFQITHLNFAPRFFFNLRVALLGMAMGANDEQAQQSLSDPRFVRDTAGYVEPAYQASLGYFQNYPYHDIREQLGAVMSPHVTAQCNVMPLVRFATTDTRFSHFVTSIDIDANDRHYPTFVRLLDGHGSQVGFGLVASRWVDRHDMKPVNGIYRLRVEGYISNQARSKIAFVAETNGQPTCQTSLTAPPPQLDIATGPLEQLRATVAIDAVKNMQSILGSDSFHSDLCAKGLRVLGTSGPRGDADSGQIALMLRRGDSFLYRSGPSSGQQFLVVNGNREVMLPEAVEWIQVTPSLSLFAGNSQIEVAIQDRGAGWGEWSAVAVRADAASCAPGASQ